MSDRPLTAKDLAAIRQRATCPDVPRLANAVERLKVENAKLQGIVTSLARRVAGQAEMLGRRAEREDQLSVPAVAGYEAAGDILDARE